jgi:MFS family permease
MHPAQDSSAAAARRAVAVALALIVLVSMPSLLTASLFPQLRTDIPMTKSLLGVAFAAFASVAALASTPAGRLVDRIGGANGIRLAAAISGACALAMATVAGSSTVVAAILGAAGAAAALAGPASSVLLGGAVGRERMGLALGLQWSGGPFAAAVAGLALPLVARPLGWRWGFAIAIALALAVAAAAPRDGAEARAAGRSPARTPQAIRWSPTVLVLVLGTALASAVGMGVVTFLVAALTHAGAGAGMAGAVLTATALGAAGLRVAAGVVADRRPHHALRHMGGMLLGSGAGLLLLASGAPLAMAAGGLVAGGLGWGWQGLINLAMVAIFPAAPGRATGVMMTGSFAGAAAGPLLVGTLADHAGFAAAWLVVGGLALTGAAAVAAGERMAVADGAAAPAPAAAGELEGTRI